MSSVRSPSCASVTARFAAAVVLPSRGSALVTRMTCGGWPACESSKARAKRAERFGHLRFRQMLRDKLDVARMAIAERIGERAPLGRVAFGILERGNDRERRQARERLDVVGRLHGVVHVFAQDREADAADEADQKRQRDVAHFRRTRRSRRNHRGIDDADVGRLQRRRNAGFLQLGEQAIVERFVGFGVALEDVVLHHALGHQVGFGLLLLERAGQQLFALLGFVEFAAEARDDGFFLALEVLVDFLYLGLEALDLRKIGAVLSEGFGVLTAEIGCGA